MYLCNLMLWANKTRVIRLLHVFYIVLAKNILNDLCRIHRVCGSLADIVRLFIFTFI